MTRDDEIFADALELPAAEREAFVARACGNDAALRTRIGKLLAGYLAAGSFIEASPVERPAGSDTAGTGGRIGRYTLLRRIGEGGCGEVHLAEQTEPIRRQVALKVIKPGMDTHQVVQRFEAERQTLALMDHPDIAKVFDAGATDAGRPYFAMEFVDGVPITKFCDDHALATEARLRLFERVCQAVHHAHQKGIIHRDLKPSNILVTSPGTGPAGPAPKIIDFGIAKATEGRLTEATIATALGQFIGTPAYMSPEQAELGGASIDTRSDIYSLGVLLYELLTGRTPFETKALLQAGFDEMRRQIGQVDPPRPSTCLKTLDQETLHNTAERRHTAPPQLVARVQGDLDWIVMRCLEKDRERRYDSAASLAQDVQRHLGHEPIVARPASAAYRFRKLVRRHRLAFGAAAALFVALVAGIVTSTWQAVRAGRAERLARDEAAVAKAVNDFLLTDLLRQADARAQVEANVKPNPDLKVREALDRAAARVVDRFKEQPLVEAAVRQAIGISYRSLGVRDEAAAHLRRAIELRQRVLGMDDGRTLELMGELALVYRDQGKFAESVALRREVVAAATRLFGPEHDATLVAMNELSDGYVGIGKFADAVELTNRVIAIRQRRLGPEHRETIYAMATLGHTLRAQGRFKEALALQREVLAVRTRLLGEDHPDTLTSLGTVGVLTNDLGEETEALGLKRRHLAATTRVHGPDHPLTLNSLNNLAENLRAARQMKEAIELNERSVEVQRRVNGPDHPKTLTGISNLAAAYLDDGRYAAAEALLIEVLKTKRRTLGQEHPDTVPTLTLLGDALRQQGKPAETLALCTETLAIARRALGVEHALTLRSMNNLAFMLNAQSRGAEAISLHLEAVETATRTLGAEHPLTLTFLSSQAATRAALGQHAQSLALRQQVLVIRRKISGPEHLLTVDAMLRLVMLYVQQKQFAEAEPLLREVLAVREKKQPDDWLTFNTRSALGGALAELRRFGEAEPLLLSGYEGIKTREARIAASDRVRLKEAAERLVQLYTETNRPEKAAEWQKTLALHTVKTTPAPAKQ